ncbi:MAG: PrsW family intramembrane metalloprotease [Anaerolineae bacterium]
MIAGIAVAVAIPIAFLLLVRWLDLYASGSFWTVILCFIWGVLAFSIVFPINDFFIARLGYWEVVKGTAPVVEEITKSLMLIYLVRRPNFTYFVDGAIFGFAIGTGFAVRENIFYLTSTPDVSLMLGLTRAFSTSLMHGSASALVGVALGRLRFARGWSRIIAPVVGWTAAIALHLSYNNIINTQDAGLIIILIGVVIGLGGVGLNAGFIMWGLQEEKRWLRETLKLDVGVSSGESSVIQKLDDLSEMLVPIRDRFGPEKAKQVETFLRLQAQLGLKRKVQAMSPDGKLREELTVQIADMRTEMDKLRRSVGVYCMSYVRSILPPETESFLINLSERMVVQEPTAKGSLWNKIGSRFDADE